MSALSIVREIALLLARATLIAVVVNLLFCLIGDIAIMHKLPRDRLNALVGSVFLLAVLFLL